MPLEMISTLAGEGVAKHMPEGMKPKRFRSVNLVARAFPENGRIVARCDALGISDHGATQEEAFENLAKTLGLFFASCGERGTIERILEKRGIPILSFGDEDDTDRVVFPVLSIIASQNANSVAG